MNLLSLRTTIVLLLLSVTVSAQIINIDKTDTSDYEKKATWNGRVALGLEVDKEKATLVDASNFLDISLQKERELFILSASNRFTYNDKQDFLNTGYIHLRWRHNYKEQWHPESFVQYQWDAARGMLHRFIAGENIRYNFWHRQMWELTVGTGVMYENELWNYTAVDSSKIPPNPVNQRSNELKSNTYIKWEGKASKVSNVSIVLFYQAAFNDFFTPRISGVVSFDMDISRHFSLGIKYSGLYDAGPVVPIFKFYYNFSNSLEYKF